jgi:hypothetical protein
MEFVCDAPGGKAWFRLETEGEALAESEAMKHAVEKYFRREREKAVASYQPAAPGSIERDIGLGAHVKRNMPMFLTLRNREGGGLATAMLPPGGREDSSFRIIVVGAANGDPYPAEHEAIEALGKHFGIGLERDQCYPYGNRTA